MTFSAQLQGRGVGGGRGRCDYSDAASRGHPCPPSPSNLTHLSTLQAPPRELRLCSLAAIRPARHRSRLLGLPAGTPESLSLPGTRPCHWARGPRPRRSPHLPVWAWITHPALSGATPACPLSLPAGHLVSQGPPSLPCFTWQLLLDLEDS